MYSIYKHTTPDGRVYVGMTKNIKQRWTNHSYSNNKRFTEAIHRYGWENILHEVICTADDKESAMRIEKEMIARYDSTNPSRGYNISSGGSGGSGVVHSEESKERTRQSLLGVKHTEERVQMQKDSAIKLWENEEHRKKMSSAHIGKMRGSMNASSKTVYQYTKDRVLVGVYESTGEAQRKTGFDRRGISACCNNSRMTSNGYIWRYEKL